MKHLITSYTRAILLMAVMLIMPSAMWADKEAYAQYADSTLTFCYDENRTSYATTYDMPASGASPGWLAHKSEVTKVVFSEDFKDARPVRCAKWFYNMSKLTDIEGMQYLCTDSVNDMSEMFFGCLTLTSLDLSHFCTESVTTMIRMFCGCKALTELDVTSFDTRKVYDMSYMFCDCVRLSKLDLITFNTQAVTNMEGMFAYDDGLTSIKVTSRFVLDQVTSSKSMFCDCYNLPGYNDDVTDKTNASIYLTYLTPQPWAEFQKDTRTLTFRYDEYKDYVTATAKYDLPTSGDPGWLENWTYIKNVVFSEAFKDARPVSCAKWFYKMKSLATITGLEYLNTSEVTDMNHMFCESSSLSSLDLSTFSTASVTSMGSMFYGCTALKELNLSSFNTQKVEDMSFMFSSCKKLTELDLTAFDTQKVTNMKSMFQFDQVLEHIYVTDLFVLDQVTNSEEMFYYCSSLPSFDKSFIDKTKAPDYLTYIAAQPWVEYQDATKTLTFRYDNTRNAVAATDKYELPAAGAPGWAAHNKNVTKVVFCESFKEARPKSCAQWFASAYHLDNIEGMEYLCTDSVSDMSYMFSMCGSLKSLDLSHFNTSKVTTMHSMFVFCNSLTALDVTTFDTRKVDDMYQMFSNCVSLTELDLSHFNTGRVTTMERMFVACYALKQLDLSSFNTSKVTTMHSMFSKCESLTSLDLTTFDTQKVTDMDWMFAEATALAHIYVSSSFILDQVTLSDDMFYLCESLPHYETDCYDKRKAPIYLTYIQPWAEYQADTKTLTFHNDRSQAAVTATAQYDLPAAGEAPGWLTYNGDIKKVVFSESFKNARPKNCGKWFYKMKYLTDIQGIQNLCTDSATDMSYMFYGCEYLTSIDLSHFNTELVTTMTNMFEECYSLSTLDVTSFDTHEVNDMSYMFRYCDMLTELDLSSFDTRKVTNMEQMFAYDSELARIYVSDLFSVDQVTSSSDMFCYSDALPRFDSHSVDKAKAHYKAGGYLTLRRHFCVGETLYNVDGYDSPTCYTNVTFTDGSAYSAPCDFTFSSDKTASYSRTTSNHWATLCLPFAFSADGNSTARFYSVGSYDNGNITATPITGEIAAGTPVLAYITNGELSVTATGAAAVAAPDTLNVLQGAFAQTAVADDEYIIANDHFWNASWLKQNNGDVKNVYVAPYRASLTLNLTAGAKPNSISIDLGETDGIDSIDTTDLAAFLDGAELYDLQGRRLSAPQRGVMIVRKGGVSRKVVIKGSQAPQGL